MHVAAVGFDLGETLLTYADTPPSWVTLYPAALADVAADCHLTPSATALGQAAEILTRYNTRLHPRREEVAASIIFREILKAWELPPKQWLATATAAFFGFFQQRMQAYPETAGVLSALRAHGVRIGVLTDVPYGMPRALVERDLTGAALAPLVDVLLTSVEVGWRKPEPQGFHLLAAKLGVLANQLWYIGNEEKDIAGARAARATAVLIDRENRRPAWGQNYTISNLSELSALLD